MELTHINEAGRARMVDVGEKAHTERTAIARGEILMNPGTIERVRQGSMKKGDVIGVAQVAGITGAKKTSDLIPMCHNIFITGCDMGFVIKEDRVEITAELSTVGQTGIEMEALTAVSIAALTIYDMCKAIDKTMKIQNIRLIKKTGGRSGDLVLEGRAMKKGIVRAVNVSSEKGVVKEPADSVVMVVDFGVEGDAHGGPGKRQVSLLARESVDKMIALTGKEDLCDGIFAENITTEGLELHTLPVGTKLKIGETLHMVSQIGKECHVGCAIMQQVGQCIMPKEGIFTQVLQGGTVKAGDEILIAE